LDDDFLRLPEPLVLNGVFRGVFEAVFVEWPGVEGVLGRAGVFVEEVEGDGLDLVWSVCASFVDTGVGRDTVLLGRGCSGLDVEGPLMVEVFSGTPWAIGFLFKEAVGPFVAGVGGRSVSAGFEDSAAEELGFESVDLLGIFGIAASAVGFVFFDASEEVFELAWAVLSNLDEAVVSCFGAAEADPFNVEGFFAPEYASEAAASGTVVFGTVSSTTAVGDKRTFLEPFSAILSFPSTPLLAASLAFLNPNWVPTPPLLSIVTKLVLIFDRGRGVVAPGLVTISEPPGERSRGSSDAGVSLPFSNIARRFLTPFEDRSGILTADLLDIPRTKSRRSWLSIWQVAYWNHQHEGFKLGDPEITWELRGANSGIWSFAVDIIRSYQTEWFNSLCNIGIGNSSQASKNSGGQSIWICWFGNAISIWE
jgi:hypothetical protein